MLDHALGRPDARYRKFQIFGVVFVWAVYLWKGHRHGPKFLRPISKFLGKHLTVWHVVVITGLHYYVLRNASTVVGLQYPEPLANMYSKEYFIATWITTALDAGFWSAMHFKPKWIRDLSSVVFSLYFLVAADQADEMVRRVRGGLTKEHLRISWNKPLTPYLAFATRMLRPRHLTMKYRPRRFVIDRPAGSAYSERINAWLYFDGPTAQLKEHDKIILDIPGGGFVAMDPRCHDDKLMAWAVKTGFPIVALDYKKAPEYAYPYALNECFDAYYQIMATRGQNIGLSGLTTPKIVVSGDSAGGNLAAGLLMMIADQSSYSFHRANNLSLSSRLPQPVAAILIYPALDVNITSWMNDEQIALMHQQKRRHINKSVIDQKRDQYRSLNNSPHASDDEDGDEEEETHERKISAIDKNNNINDDKRHLPPLETGPSSPTAERLSAAATKLVTATQNPTEAPPTTIKTRLYMRSMIAYFNDRVLSPEMLRGMIMMYVGEHNRPDFDNDYLLSPIRAPDGLLAQLPKIYMLTGERDPLIDDTVLFAARIRQAKLQVFRDRKDLDLIPEAVEFNDTDHVETYLVPRVSHGFLQFAGIYRRGWAYIEQCSRWMKEAFQLAGEPATPSVADDISISATPSEGVTPRASESISGDYFTLARAFHRRRSRDLARSGSGVAGETSTGASSDAEDRPLEMTSALRMTPLTAPFSTTGTTTSSRQTHKSTTAAASGTAAEKRRTASGRGSIRKPHGHGHHHSGNSTFSGRKSPVALRNSRSLQRLASTEDLMDRRMTELAEGLKGGSTSPTE